MQHCIMGPPDGTECGGFEDSSNVIAGDSTHGNGGYRIATDGTRVTFGKEETVHYPMAAVNDTFAALTAGLNLTMSVDPTGTDTELCDERNRGIMTMGTGACGTELADRSQSIATAGGDEEEDTGDTAARFTLVDILTAVGGDDLCDERGGDDDLCDGRSLVFTSDEHIYEGNRLHGLVAA
jgi:hypothetical protein